MKGGTKSFVQLAEDWLSNSYHILEMPFSDSNYHAALVDAEQFLWADHDVDSVYLLIYTCLLVSMLTLNLGL